MALLGNGVCDEACDMKACGYDGHDCGRCSELCRLSMVGNGACDVACNNPACNYDKDSDGNLDCQTKSYKNYCNENSISDNVCVPNH